MRGDDRFEGFARPTILRILDDPAGNFGRHRLNRGVEVVAVNVSGTAPSQCGTRSSRRDFEQKLPDGPEPPN